MTKRDRLHSKDNTHADSIWIYFIQEADSDLFKIGFSNDPRNRRSTFQVGNPHELVIRFTYQTQRPRDLEDQIHIDLVSSLIRGEWYALPSEPDYQSIIRNAENNLNIRNEKALQRDVEVEIERLNDHLKELKLVNTLSVEREASIKNHSDVIMPNISFDSMVTDQIKAQIDQIEILYNVFDSVSINPDDLTLSLNEAMFHAFLAEPDIKPIEARELSKAAIGLVTKRRHRHKNYESVGRVQNNGTYMDYHSLCLELLHQKRLTVVPQAIVRMSANVICTSPAFILALNCRLRKITTGQPNVLLIRSVLGMGDEKEFNMYLSQVRDYNLHGKLCSVNVNVKGQKSIRQCGIRINFGKETCSYHLRHKNSEYVACE